MHLPRENQPFRLALVAACAVLLIAATPVVAQQATDATVPAAASAGARVMPGPGSADQAALIRAAVLNAAGTTPVAAEPADASAPLAGPRVRPDVRGVEPRLAEDWASALSAAAPPPNTIVISTLALVLIAVIITILVVK